MTVVPVGVDHTVFRPREEVEPVPGRIMVTSSSDVPMKGLVPLLEAVAKLRTERDIELVVIGNPRRRRTGGQGHQTPRPGPDRALRDRDQRRRAGPQLRPAQVAVVPSLYEGFSLPAIEAMACGVALVATTGGALPEVVGTDGSHRLAGRAGRPGGAGRWPSAACSTTTNCVDRLGAAGRDRVLGRFTWQVTAAGTAAEYRALLDGRTGRQGPKDGGPSMLTVDYSRLGVRPGDRVLDLGCGFGRHAYQAARLGCPGGGLRRRCRRGAQGPGHLRRHGRGRRARCGDGPGGRRPGRCPPTAVRRRVLRPGDRLGGPRAHPRRRGGHGRTGPGAPPGRLDGGDRAPVRPRVRQLGAVRRLPQRARWPRAHLPAEPAGRPAPGHRSAGGREPSRPRSPRPLLVAPVPGRSDQRQPPRRRHLPPVAGVGHRKGAQSDPVRRSGAQSAGRARAWSSTSRSPPIATIGTCPPNGSRSGPRRWHEVDPRGPRRDDGRPGDGHRPVHRGAAAPGRDDPVVSRRALRPVEPRRGGHGPHRRRVWTNRPTGPISGWSTPSSPTAAGSTTT